MTHADLVTLLDFHYWARDRMLEAVRRLSPEQYVRDLRNSFGSVRDTAVHIYSADWVWQQRWRGTSPGVGVVFGDYPDVDTLADAWVELEAATRSDIGQLDDAAINRVCDYRNLAGKPGRSCLWHVVQHMVNHGSYHRGQITTMLRQLGAESPKGTDLISYYRERAE